MHSNAKDTARPLTGLCRDRQKAPPAAAAPQPAIARQQKQSEQSAATREVSSDEKRCSHAQLPGKSLGPDFVKTCISGYRVQALPRPCAGIFWIFGTLYPHFDRRKTPKCRWRWMQQPRALRDLKPVPTPNCHAERSGSERSEAPRGVEASLHLAIRPGSLRLHGPSLCKGLRRSG